MWSRRLVGFGAELGDDLAVHSDEAGLDELFRVAPRGDSGAGDYFLQAFLHQRGRIGRHKFDLCATRVAENRRGGECRVRGVNDTREQIETPGAERD